MSNARRHKRSCSQCLISFNPRKLASKLRCRIEVAEDADLVGLFLPTQLCHIRFVPQRSRLRMVYAQSTAEVCTPAGALRFSFFLLISGVLHSGAEHGYPNCVLQIVRIAAV